MLEKEQCEVSLPLFRQADASDQMSPGPALAVPTSFVGITGLCRCNLKWTVQCCVNTTLPEDQCPELGLLGCSHALRLDVGFQ